MEQRRKEYNWTILYMQMVLQQIETQLLMRQYDGLMKGGRVQGRQAVTSA